MKVKSVDIITRAGRPDQFSAAPDRDQKRRRLWLHTLFFQPKQHAPLLGPACFLLDSSSLHLLLHLRRCSSPGMLRSLPPCLATYCFARLLPSDSIMTHFFPNFGLPLVTHASSTGAFSFIFAHSSSGLSRPIAIARTLLFSVRVLPLISFKPTDTIPISAGTVVSWRIGSLSLSSSFHLALPRPSVGGSGYEGLFACALVFAVLWCPPVVRRSFTFAPFGCSLLHTHTLAPRRTVLLTCS